VASDWAKELLGPTMASGRWYLISGVLAWFAYEQFYPAHPWKFLGACILCLAIWARTASAEYQANAAAKAVASEGKKSL